MHRDLANEVSRVTFKNEGRLSKILRHEDPGRTQEYLVRWCKWSALVGLAVSKGFLVLLGYEVLSYLYPHAVEL